MGAFSWLADGISHGYYPTLVPGIGDTPHFANDIGTPFHTTITALFPGTVVSEQTGLPWGTQIFIQPDDPSLPQYYYYHLDTLSVVPGQHLAAGQPIGLSGGQNSGGANPSTPAMSSGPHTHVGFFTKYISTPLGTRPYGPDITPYIKALAQGQTPPAGPGGGTTSTSGPTVLPANLQGFAVKAGIILMCVVLLLFGAYMIFKKQADEGFDVAKHLGLDAVMA